MSIRIDTPLDWPAQQPRTPRGRQSNLHGFSPSLTIEDAIRFLEDELVHFQVDSVVVSTHIEHFLSPRLRKLEGTNPAIALKIKHDGFSYHLACDRWLTPQHNIYAIAITLRQLRQVDGYGVFLLQEVLAIRSPHQAIAAAAATGQHTSVEPWRAALGLGPSATLADANAVYRARAKQVGEHNQTELSALNDAIELARKHLSD